VIPAEVPGLPCSHLITGHVGPTQALLVDVKHHLITGHVGPTQALLVDVKQNIHQCWRVLTTWRGGIIV